LRADGHFSNTRPQKLTKETQAAILDAQGRQTITYRFPGLRALAVFFSSDQMYSLVFMKEEW
jgi:hypothetical protein